MDRQCPFRRVCDTYKQADAILKFTKHKAKTVSEINIHVGLSNITVRRMCNRLFKLGYLDVMHTTVSSRGTSGKINARGAKAYINRW